MPPKVKSTKKTGGTASASGNAVKRPKKSNSATVKGEDETSAEESSLAKLKSAIEKVRNMKLLPPIKVFTVKVEKSSTSLSAVDVNRNCQFLAGSFNESADIFVKIRAEQNIPETEDEDLLLQYNSLRVAKEEYEKNSRLSNYSTDGPNKYLLGHTLPVTGLKFVPQKELLMSCSLDGTARAWSTIELRIVQLYSGIEEFYCAIDVSRNSSYFATGGLKGKVSLFSFDRKCPVKYFPGHTDDVNCLRFHPNGIYIATASDDNSIKLWSTQSASIVRTFQDDSCPRSLAFSPDGKYLASYSGGYIKIWDLASGQLLKMFFDSDEESRAYSLCFSEFGGILASGGMQKKIKLWDIKHFSSETQDIPQEDSLLRCHSLPRKIQLLKFDENNFFTCVTA